MVDDEQVQDVTSKSWSVWTAVGTVAAGFAFLIGTLAVMITLGPSAYSSLHLSSAEAAAANTIVASAVSVIAGYLLARMLVVSGPREFFLSIAWRPSFSRIVLAMLLGFCMTILTRFISTGRLDNMVSRDIHRNLFFALLFLGTIVMQPFAEEMYFRGILFSGLASKLNPFLSICIVTLAFVLGHVQHRWIVLPVGIVLGLVRLFTKSTANCFALHAAYNLGILFWGIR